MTPDSDNPSPLKPDASERVEAPLDQDSAAELLSGELNADPEVTELRRQGSELSVGTQETIELHIAKTFLEESLTLFGTLVQAVSPAVFSNQYGHQAQSSKEFPFRQRLLDTRDAVYELLKRGSDLAKTLNPLVQEGASERLAALVAGDLRTLVADVDQFYDGLEQLQLEVYEAFVTLKIQNFPSQRAVEQQTGNSFASVTEFFSFRDKLLDNDSDRHIVAPLRFGRSLWSFVTFQPEDRDQVDINTTVAQTLVLGSDVDVKISEASPVASVRPADFKMLMLGTQSWLTTAIREASKQYMREIGAGNRVFELIAQNDFMDTAEGRFLNRRFLEDDEARIEVQDSGEVTISIVVSAEIVDSLKQEFSAASDTGRAISELAERNQIGYDVSFADGRMCITYSPIALNAKDDTRLETLKELFDEKLLGLTPVDEFGIPQGDAFEPEMDPEELREEQSNSLLLLPREVVVPDSSEKKFYMLAVQAAAVFTREAGAKLGKTAARIDQFASLLPEMRIAVVQKVSIQLAEPQDEPERIVKDRYAMTLDQAYRKGTFDSITFSSGTDSTPDPGIWSKRLTMVLEAQFRWATAAESLPVEPELEQIDEEIGAQTVQSNHAPQSDVELDFDTFSDPATLEALQNLSRFGHFHSFGVNQDALTHIAQEKTASPPSPVDLLKETARVVATIGERYAEGSLSFSLDFTSVPQFSNRRKSEPVVKLEVQNDAKEVVLKGHLVPEAGKILFREVVPARTVELLSRVEKALGNLQSGASDIHDIVHALEAENVRISEPIAALALFGHVSKSSNQVKPAELLKKMLIIPGVYIDRDSADQLIMRRYRNEELSSAD